MAKGMDVHIAFSVERDFTRIPEAYDAWNMLVLQIYSTGYGLDTVVSAGIYQRSPLTQEALCGLREFAGVALRVAGEKRKVPARY